MTNLLTDRYRAFMQFVRNPMREQETTALANLTITSGVSRTNPKPTIQALLNAGPESVEEIRGAGIVGGDADIDIAMKALPSPVRSAETLSAKRTDTLGHGTGHAKIVDRIERDSNTDVFDLTIPKHHNFAVDAGVFVHNCDAPEDDQYGYEINGVLVSDWVYTSWFDPIRPGPYDYKGHIQKAGEILPGGYIGQLDAGGAQWTQVFNSAKRPAAHHLGLYGTRFDRRIRRHGLRRSSY